MAMRQLTTAILLLTICVASTCLSAADLSTPEAKQLTYATGLMRLGLYYEAAEEYGLFVTRFPRDPNAGSAAYYRAYAWYRYSTRSTFRNRARQAVAEFHKNYPNHPRFNLGYFLLGEIAMDEALELEAELNKLKRNNQPTTEVEAKFKKACERALPEYTAFIENTDLAKLASEGNTNRLEDMTRRVVTAYYNIAQCRRGLGQFGEAVAVYRILAARPEFADWGRDEAQFMIGQTYLDWARAAGGSSVERFTKARDEFKNIMFYGTGPGGRSEFSDDAKLGEAWCLYEIGSTNDCRDLLRDNEKFFNDTYALFKDNPNGVEARWVRSLWPEIYYLYGKSFFKDRKYEDAKTWFERVMNMGGDNPWKAEATRMLDECLAEIDKDQKRVVATVEDAIKAYDLAYNKYVTGQRESAAADFERIWRQFKGVRTWDHRDKVLYYWGKSLYGSGDDGRLFEAAAVFQYLSKMTDSRVTVPLEDGQNVWVITEALYWEGHSNWRLAEGMDEGRQKDAFIAEAILAFEKLAYIQPYHPKTAETLLNVGHHYLRSKEYVRAGLAYHKMVTLFPSHPDRPKALVNLCYVYRELDRLDDVLWAASEFEQTYPKDPGVVRIIDLKGNAFFKRAKAAQAPEQEQAYYAKAAAEYSKLKPDAFAWLPPLQREREFGKIFANAMFYAGFSYEKIGQTDKAIEFYQTFVDIAPPGNSFRAEGFARCAQAYYDAGRYADAVAVVRPFAAALNGSGGLDPTQDKGGEAVAVLAASLLKLGAAEADAAKAKELVAEAVAEAERLYEVYRTTPIGHQAYMTVAAAFRDAGRFDDMLAAYKALDANQRLHLDRAGASVEDNRRALASYTQLLFEAGGMIADTADELAKKGADTRQFDVTAGDFLARHLEQAKRILGRGKIPANSIEVYFRTASMLKRAGESDKAARALNKIITFAAPDHPDFLKAYYERGNVWREGGNPKRSLASYIYIIDYADKTNAAWKTYAALSRYHAGIALYTLDRKNAAKEQFTKLIETFAQEEGKDIQNAVTQARERLREIEQETAEAPSAG
ncbi:MAG: tetratricopeptide repeat protein [Verrucomicrobia bacterium]|nr:tetratricopeptide repeat protein [Verrucomicrobiota bacterium]